MDGCKTCVMCLNNKVFLIWMDIPLLLLFGWILEDDIALVIRIDIGYLIDDWK